MIKSNLAEISNTIPDQKPIRVIRRNQVEDKTGLSRSSIYDRIANGTFPKAINLGGKAVGWIESEIDEWLKAKMNDRYIGR